jgi:preprotein translocase subunit SecA
VFSGADEKWAALTTRVKGLQTKGQPVLIGTGSVAESEDLSRRLTASGVAHRVLNARQDEAEAEIVAQAGRKGQVTVATNMAGRGTDILLAEGVAERGGLRVIATCRNDAQRIDRQLFGRCARQGDPGSYEVMLSLEDEIIQKHCRPSLVALLRRLLASNSGLANQICRHVFKRVQGRIEDRHREMRRALLQQERQTTRMLAFSGHSE